MKALFPSIIAVAFALPAIASDVSIAPGLPGWQELTFSGKTPNRWNVENGSLVIDSASSVSIRYLPVRVDPVAEPVLRWRWRVDQAPPPTDLARKGGDDRAITLTVGFAYDSAAASLGERMKRGLVEQFAGRDAPGRVIDLTWGGTAPEGSVLSDPYAGSAGRQVVMQVGSASGWVEESVDVAALYRRIWGAEPPAITQIGIYADSDDTGTAARSRIADIRFEPN